MGSRKNTRQQQQQLATVEEREEEEEEQRQRADEKKKRAAAQRKRAIEIAAQTTVSNTKKESRSTIVPRVLAYSDRAQEDFLQRGFAHSIVSKCFHFRTRHGFHHAAVDTYAKSWAANYDQFMEVSQGIYGRVALGSLDLGVVLTPATPAAMTKILNQYAAYLGALSFSTQESALANIRDQMVGDAQRLVYLLSFE